ncbi:MAG: RseA family anti-sigma factor [Granulosicoccaceae bacterium]
MNTPDDKEILSQLMDGEWQDIDSQVRISDLCSDSGLKATWARYHLARDVMKNESVKVETDIASRVWAALEDEPAHTNVTPIGTDMAGGMDIPDRPATTSVPATIIDQSVPAKRRTAFGGLAIAASVALATVFGLNFMQTADNGDQPQAIAALPTTQVNPVILGQVVLPQIELVANRGTYWVNASVDSSVDRNANQEERLNMFLAQHIEHSPTTSHQGMLPYSRLVGYDDINASQGAGQ